LSADSYGVESEKDAAPTIDDSLASAPESCEVCEA
jgi:hypothetical protein